MITRHDIPKFFPVHYQINVSLDHLPFQIERYIQTYNLEVSPDFQRHYVWNEEQRIRYMEYLFRGGISGKDFYFNCPYWPSGTKAQMVLVDGQQRLRTIFMFLDNEVPIFNGHYFKDFEDGEILLRGTDVIFRINNLTNKKDVLQWYIDLNAGGTVHTNEDIEKVYKLMEELPDG